jgi:hypothetical protein
MKKFILPFIPALLSFGPFFIAFAAQAPNSSQYSWLRPATGYGGAVGLGLGLIFLFWRQQRLERDLDRLRQER